MLVTVQVPVRAGLDAIGTATALTALRQAALHLLHSAAAMATNATENSLPLSLLAFLSFIAEDAVWDVAHFPPTHTAGMSLLPLTLAVPARAGSPGRARRLTQQDALHRWLREDVSPDQRGVLSAALVHHLLNNSRIASLAPGAAPLHASWQASCSTARAQEACALQGAACGMASAASAAWCMDSPASVDVQVGSAPARSLSAQRADEELQALEAERVSGLQTPSTTGTAETRGSMSPGIVLAIAGACVLLMGGVLFYVYRQQFGVGAASAPSSKVVPMPDKQSPAEPPPAPCTAPQPVCELQHRAEPRERAPPHDVPDFALQPFKVDEPRVASPLRPLAPLSPLDGQVDSGTARQLPRRQHLAPLRPSLRPLAPFSLHTLSLSNASEQGRGAGLPHSPSKQPETPFTFEGEGGSSRGPGSAFTAPSLVVPAPHRSPSTPAYRDPFASALMPDALTVEESEASLYAFETEAASEEVPPLPVSFGPGMDEEDVSVMDNLPVSGRLKRSQMARGACGSEKSSSLDSSAWEVDQVSEMFLSQPLRLPSRGRMSKTSSAAGSVASGIASSLGAMTLDMSTSRSTSNGGSTCEPSGGGQPSAPAASTQHSTSILAPFGPAADAQDEYP